MKECVGNSGELKKIKPSDMALMTTTKVRINGKVLPYYETLELKQEINDHHYLTLVCRTDDIPVENPTKEQALGAFKEHIGAAITIEIIPIRKDDTIYTDDFRFSGMIVKIDEEWQSLGRGGLITLYGCSGTIMADGAPNYNSYHKQSLAFIAEETLRGYHRNALIPEIKPAHPQLTDEILYSVQQGCSDFEYLQRLASYYGQWLYSADGKTLILGTPGTKQTILQYGKDLKSMRLEMRPTPNQFTYITDDYLEDSGQHQKDASEANTSSEMIQSYVYQKAAELFPKKTNQYHDNPHHDNPRPRSIMASRFGTQIEEYSKSRALNQVVMVGNSDNPRLRLGDKIGIQGHGQYRVIKITHTNTFDGDYENHFEAIEASTAVYPKMDLNQTPKSGSQVAKVTNNADPEGLGRVQVQLPWQVVKNKNTPWIRMLTQHAGLDRGAYCVPEIGDEVLVDFQGGNAERPYIVGSLYNKTQAPDGEWASKDNVEGNNVKALRTRSGHTIKLDDTKGGEMITITDKNSNLITIDTANNNMTIAAGETMTLTAKNINIKAGEDINMVAGNNFTKSVGEDYNVMTKNNTLIVQENLSTDSKKQENISDEITLSSNAKNLTLASGKTVDIQSKEKVKLF